MRQLCCLLMAALVAAFLCACGGGGDGVPVAVLGDSINSGTYVAPDGSIARLAVPPVERMNELAAGRLQLEDRAIPGMIAAEAVSGGFGWMQYAANEPLVDVLKTSRARIVVIRFGTADALRGIGPDLFRANLREVVRITRAAGKTPVLVEPIHQLANFAPAADALQAVVLDVAAVDAVSLILVRDLPWTLGDGIHPDQATADRLVARIVQRLLELLLIKEAGDA